MDNCNTSNTLDKNTWAVSDLISIVEGDILPLD